MIISLCVGTYGLIPPVIYLYAQESVTTGPHILTLSQTLRCGCSSCGASDQTYLTHIETKIIVCASDSVRQYFGTVVLCAKC